MDSLVIAGKAFHSRLIVGTGKYKNGLQTAAALEASGAEIVTVAVRRVNLDRNLDGNKESLLDYIDPKKYFLLPNTAGCYTADEAIRVARMGREVGLSDWVKIEVIGDEKTLYPDVAATIEATRVLVKEGFTVLPYTSDDPVVALRLVDAGAAVVMPLGAPIGSGLGIQNTANLRILRELIPSLPLIVDAGVGTPSDAALAPGRNLPLVAQVVTAPASSATPALSHSHPSRRPAWLPGFIPAFDGLRGIAILAVLLYHSHPRLEGTFLEKFVIWGWTGVSLFFVLSGFLITGIILDARPGPGFYAHFFSHRALRIWPAYWLLLFLHYFFFPFVFSGYKWMLHEVAAAPWLLMLLFLQNLWPVSLPGSIGPTWSLAIEQQFYLFWTPLARHLPPRWLLVAAGAMLAISPAVRLFYGGRLTSTNTVTHLDSLAVGSLIAIALRVFAWTPAVWKWIARAALCVGAGGVWLMLHRGSAFTDSLLAFGFGGMLLEALLGDATPRRSLYCRALEFRPLAFVGKISYGLYLIHILVFSLLGGYVDKHLDGLGIPGNLAIVAIRVAVAIGCAALMWFYFEKPILAYKR